MKKRIILSAFGIIVLTIGIVAVVFGVKYSPKKLSSLYSFENIDRITCSTHLKRDDGALQYYGTTLDETKYQDFFDETKKIKVRRLFFVYKQVNIIQYTVYYKDSSSIMFGDGSYYKEGSDGKTKSTFDLETNQNEMFHLLILFGFNPGTNKFE